MNECIRFISKIWRMFAGFTLNIKMQLTMGSFNFIYFTIFSAYFDRTSAIKNVTNQNLIQILWNRYKWWKGFNNRNYCNIYLNIYDIAVSIQYFGRIKILSWFQYSLLGIFYLYYYFVLVFAGKECFMYKLFSGFI